MRSLRLYIYHVFVLLFNYKNTYDTNTYIISTWYWVNNLINRKNKAEYLYPFNLENVGGGYQCLQNYNLSWFIVYAMAIIFVYSGTHDVFHLVKCLLISHFKKVTNLNYTLLNPQL